MRLSSILILGLLIGAAAFVLSPATFGLVDSESMEPTISPGDAYISVPADDYTEGDIITFYSPERGEYVVHRIIEETPDGYITQGDNNPRTDQEKALPPVTEEQVLGKIPVVAGSPVVIQGGADVIMFFEQYTYLILAALILVYAFASPESRRLDRKSLNELHVKRFSYRQVALSATFLFWVTTAVLLVTLPESEALQVVVVGAEQARGPLNPMVGEVAQQSITYTFNESPLYVHASSVSGPQMEKVGMEVSKTSVKTMIEFGPYPSAGARTGRIIHHVYPHLLPKNLIYTLHGIHPIIAAVVTTAPILIIGTIASFVLTEDIRMRRFPKRKL